MNPGTFQGIGGTAGRKVVGLLAATWSTPGSTAIAQMANYARCAIVSATSAAADINALQQIVSISGRGRINWAALYHGGSSLNLRAVLEVDGVRLFDQDFGTILSDYGFVMLGGGQATSPASAIFQPIEFSSSLRILGGMSAAGKSMTARFNAELYE